MLNLPLTQEVLECEYYTVELETDLTSDLMGPRRMVTSGRPSLRENGSWPLCLCGWEFERR